LRTATGRFLLAFNDSEQGRQTLGLAVSADGIAWRRIVTLEDGTETDEYSYPYLIRTTGGEYHLVYTWKRRRLAHLRFNEAWLEARQ
jgi:predicted neuraminidase